VESGRLHPPFWCHGATGIGRLLLHAARTCRSVAKGSRWSGPTLTPAAGYGPTRLRLRILAVAGRLVCTARRTQLKTPQSWPWADQISTAHAGLAAPDPAPPTRSPRTPSTGHAGAGNTAARQPNRPPKDQTAVPKITVRPLRNIETSPDQREMSELDRFLVLLLGLYRRVDGRKACRAVVSVSPQAVSSDHVAIAAHHVRSGGLSRPADGARVALPG
jgi:hypothetical protein